MKETDHTVRDGQLKMNHQAKVLHSHMVPRVEISKLLEEELEDRPKPKLKPTQDHRQVPSHLTLVMVEHNLKPNLKAVLKNLKCHTLNNS